MPSKQSPAVDPDLLPLINALARLAFERQKRETEEAVVEITTLRLALRLEDDFPNWKRKAEGLMKAFYNHVPESISIPLKVRLRLVTEAVCELGPNASYRRIAIRAAELAELKTTKAPRRGQPRRS